MKLIDKIINYIASPRPSLPASLPIFISDELQRVSNSLNSHVEVIKELEEKLEALQNQVDNL